MGRIFGYQLYYSSIDPQPKQNRLFYKIGGVMHVGERLRFLHVIKLINQVIESPREILDAGAGNGNYAFYPRNIFPRAQITAIDISKEKVANVSNIAHLFNVRNILFAQKTLTDLKEREKYDLVVCIDVLEHINNDILPIKSIRNSLKPGGTLSYTFLKIENYFTDISNVLKILTLRIRLERNTR